MADQQAGGGSRRSAADPGASSVAAALGGSREPASGWRATLQSRSCVAPVFALWTVGDRGAARSTFRSSQHAELPARADRQQMRHVKLPAKRGEIVDRNGRVLAYSVDADTVFADPLEIEEPAGRSRALSGRSTTATPSNRQAMAQSCAEAAQFAYLARKISPDEAPRVRALKLKGIGFVKESRRYYPKQRARRARARLRRHRQRGLAGLESTYDSAVRGQDGKVLVQTDARQHALFSRVERRRPPARRSSSRSISSCSTSPSASCAPASSENHAAGGIGVIMDPHTGEILALAN